MDALGLGQIEPLPQPQDRVFRRIVGVNRHVPGVVRFQGQGAPAAQGAVEVTQGVGLRGSGGQRHAAPRRGAAARACRS